MVEAALEDDRPRSVGTFELWHARQPEGSESIGGGPCLTAPGSKRQTLSEGALGLDDPPLRLDLAVLHLATGLVA